MVRKDIRTGFVMTPPTRGAQQISSQSSIHESWKDCHDDPVIHVRDAGRVRCRAFGAAALQPGVHGARQRRRIAGHRHSDVTRVDIGVLMQGFDDAVADVTDSRLRRHGDVVRHTAHASNVSNRSFGGLLLIQPLHGARKGEMAAVNNRLNGFWNEAVKRQRPGCVLGDIWIGPLETKANREVVRHRSDAVYPLGGPLGRELAGIRVDEAAQGHSPALGRDADRTFIYHGIPVELPHDSVAHSNISLGQRCSGHDVLLDCVSGVADGATFATEIANAAMGRKHRTVSA